MLGAVAFVVLLAVVQVSLGSKEGAADRLAEDFGVRIAIMIVGGPLSSGYSDKPVLSMGSIKGALESFKKYVVAPLTARGSSLDFFVCLDSTDPEDERELRPLIEDTLGKPQLMVFEQDCDETCQNIMAAHEEHGERDDGVYLLAPRQFFRRKACFQRLAAHERAAINSGESRYSFIMMARPDLQWLADFPDDGLDPNQVGLKYSRANGINLTLAHLSRPIPFVGENTCSDEMMRHRCVTVDDTFAVVPALQAKRFFEFPVFRQTEEYTALLVARRSEVRAGMCGCWWCAEGRLTEYLLVRSVPFEGKPFAFILRQHIDHNVGRASASYNPTTAVQCTTLGRPGGWGLSGWLLQHGFLKRALPDDCRESTFHGDEQSRFASVYADATGACDSVGFYGKYEFNWVRDILSDDESLSPAEEAAVVKDALLLHLGLVDGVGLGSLNAEGDLIEERVRADGARYAEAHGIDLSFVHTEAFLLAKAAYLAKHGEWLQ
jgi:hypothetical protein